MWPLLALAVTAWIPGPPPAALSDVADLLYAGPGGSIVRIDDTLAAAALDGTATVLDVRPGEALVVLLVEDADRVELETEGRILLAADHELVVATPKGIEPIARTDGYAQVVRLPEESLAWSRRGDVPARAPDVLVPAIVQMVDEMSEASYAATWETLVAFGTRHTYSPENVLATDWILEQLLAFGLDARFHTYEQGGAPRRNVVATIPGSVDPTRVVYLTGHLDSTSPTPYVCAPGADDNASGTAAVIEAARVLSGYSFAYTIELVCFNGEEQGLVGSGAYVADVVASGVEVIGDVNADMIAYRGVDPAPPDLVLYTNTWSQDLTATVTTVVSDYVGDVIEPVVIMQNLLASDHASFWAFGFRAVLAIEAELWDEEFNPWLHTCNDVIDNCELAYATNAARGLMAAVAALAVPDDVTAVADAGPTAVRRRPAYPNPTRGLLRVPVRLAGGGEVALVILDARGRRLRTVPTAYLAPGLHELTWDGRDDAGRPVAAGVYYLRIPGERPGAGARVVLLR